MDYRTLVLLITGLLHLLVGGFVFQRNPRNAVHRAFLLDAVFMATWSLLGACIWSPGIQADPLFFGRLAHAFGLFCCLGFLNLVLVFPGRWGSFPSWFRPAAWVLGLIIATQAVLTPDLLSSARFVSGALRATYGDLRYAYFGYSGLCFVAGFADLIRRSIHSQGMPRRQAHYVLGGLALTALLTVPVSVVAPLLGEPSVAWMGPVCTLAFIGMVAHAIVRHRLMGVHLLVGRGVSYALALAIAIGLFLGVLSLLDLLPAATQSPAASALALVIALLLFQPLSSRIQAAVSRYFYRPPYDYQSTVRDTSRALAGTLDLERALSYLLKRVVGTLQVERAIVLIRDRASQEFPVRAVHDVWAEEEGGAGEGAGLTSASPLVAHLENTHDVVVREEIEQLVPRDRSAVVTEEMRHFRADVAVPMFSGTVLLAVLLVGPKLSGDIFSSQDIDLLSTLGAEGAAAIANAQLHLEAVQAERLATLGGLAAGIAHEVKNPLVAVRTFAELLPDNYADPEFRQDFSRVVLGEVERIDRLIAQLLNYARPMPPRLEPVCLDSVIRETLRLLSYELTRHRIELRDECAPELPSVMADAAQLRQVVLNITLNAIQVMPAGGVLRVGTYLVGSRRERVGIPSLLAPGAMVEMEIANSGPPIPEGNLARVFEPFFSTRNGGTGLGLSICKRIVTEHKGQIRAVHTSDGLTAFRVRLPTADRPAASPPRKVGVGETLERLS